jgi:hypothetical protein
VSKKEPKTRGGSGKRAGKKKVSCRDGSMRKRTAIKAWDCGEVCGGEDRWVPCCSEGGQSYQKLDGVDPLTLKKGSVRGGGQKNKVRGQTTRDK